MEICYDSRKPAYICYAIVLTETISSPKILAKMKSIFYFDAFLTLWGNG